LVKEWIDNGALIVDVRTPEEFASGHYENAVNIPLVELESKIDLFGDKDNKIVVYCRVGNRSGKAEDILKKNGYKNVVNGGGLKDMQVTH
jgi:phage shock protein E